jgi:ketosteroid isomerase-like protein
MKTIFGILLFLLGSALHAEESDSQKIEKLLGEFSNSIATKEQNAFLNLFYSEQVLWLAVVNDADVKSGQKVNLHDQREFIRWVVTDPQPKEVRFSNLSIQTDGDVASVYCDYAFYLNRKMTNFGKEIFNLVRTQDGWKIAAISFSSVQPTDDNQSPN